MTMSHIIRNPFTGTRELTRYLGCGQSELVPYEQEERILPGDIFLLCTDGLTDMVSKEDIVSTISGIEVPSEAVTALLTEALARGGYDNITIIMCYINDMP
jgi:protein phosphatase